MNRRSSIQLRKRDRSIPECTRGRSLSVPNYDIAYERERKRKYREKIRNGKSLERRGPKETVGLKSMIDIDLKEYERKRKKLYRERKKYESKSPKEDTDDSNKLEYITIHKVEGSRYEERYNDEDIEFV